jgi:hypothetical protein
MHSRGGARARPRERLRIRAQLVAHESKHSLKAKSEEMFKFIQIFFQNYSFILKFSAHLIGRDKIKENE